MGSFKEAEALLPKKTPLYYALTVVMCILPIGLNYVLFDQGLHWLAVAATYVLVLAPMPYLLTLALNLDFRILVAPEIKNWKKQAQVGLIFGFPFALALYVWHYLWARDHVTVIGARLKNKTEGLLFGFFFTFLYPAVEELYFRVVLLRAVNFKPTELAKLLNCAIYGLTYYAALRFCVSSESWAWVWFAIIFVWTRITIQIKGMFGGIATTVGHILVNLTLSIILYRLLPSKSVSVNF